MSKFTVSEYTERVGIIQQGQVKEIDAQIINWDDRVLYLHVEPKIEEGIVIAKLYDSYTNLILARATINVSHTQDDVSKIILPSVTVETMFLSKLNNNESKIKKSLDNRYNKQVLN